MFSNTTSTGVVGFIALALVTVVAGCSSDNPTTPSPQIDATTLRITAGQAQSDAGPPAEGVVVEGVSVPDVALGFTRAQVEDAYGDDPVWCQSGGAPGNRAFCSWAVNGGGQVDVHFVGSDGGTATGSPDDVASRISWSEAVGGWTTTAGVNTVVAREDPQTVIDAYPNARVTYNQWGGIYSVRDTELGIDVVWEPDFYAGTTHIRMAVFNPYDAPPIPEQLTYVYSIDLTAKKVQGKRQIRGFVGVRDETQTAASGATVFARWTFPDGSTQAAESNTSQSGYAYFEITDIPRGAYTLTIEDVVLEDHRFDAESSVLSANINVK